MGMFQPACQGLNIVGRDRIAILPTQQVFKQNFKGFWQAGEISQGVGGKRQAVVMVGFIFDLERILAGLS